MAVKKNSVKPKKDKTVKTTQNKNRKTKPVLRVD